MKDITKIITDINKTLKDEYRGCISVSKLCSNYLKTQFDEIKMANLCYQKGLVDPTYKYANMTVDDILNMWHEKANTSKRYGTLLDEYADLYLNNNYKLDEWKLLHNFNDDERLKNTCTGVSQFYNYVLTKTNYRYISRELPIYNKTLLGNMINGRFDCLLYDEITDAYIIIDWKTTEDIKTTSKYDKLLGPCKLLDDCDMNLYTIQLHIYKKALVETYKLCPENRISVYVCNLLRKPINGIYFMLYKQNFLFDINFLNSCIDFAYLYNEN